MAAVAVSAAAAAAVSASAAANSSRHHREELRKECSVNYDSGKCDSVCQEHNVVYLEPVDFWNVQKRDTVTNQCIDHAPAQTHEYVGVNPGSVLLLVLGAVVVFVALFTYLNSRHG